MANPEHVAILRQGVDAWNHWRRRQWNEAVGIWQILPELSGADLSHLDLSEANLAEANLGGANLRSALLIGTDLSSARLHSAQLQDATMQEANLHEAHLYRADLSRANLRAADLSGAYMTEATLTGADLTRAMMVETVLYRSNLNGARLTGAWLHRAILVGSNLSDASIFGARVHGIAAWDVEKDNLKQGNLTVTPLGEPVVMVDDLEMAQFVYFLLRNRNIDDVITGVTSRAVLIIGRFTKERKTVLESIRDQLRDRGLVPILFDWPTSEVRSLTETIQLLANMSRFVVADITDAKSIPQELTVIIPRFPSVPVRPVIQSSQREYALFKEWENYRNTVLPVFLYEDEADLTARFDEAVMDPVRRWEEATDKEKAREMEYQNQIKALRAELERLKNRERP